MNEPKAPVDMQIGTGAAAMILGVSAQTLRAWQKAGKGPKFWMTPGGIARYSLRDLERFLIDSQNVKGADECQSTD